MKVYCPCKERCSGYDPRNGSYRRCELAQTSKDLPQKYSDKVRIRDIYSFHRQPNGKMVEDSVKFEVWRCPACHCEVLYRKVGGEGHTSVDPLAEITNC